MRTASNVFVILSEDEQLVEAVRAATSDLAIVKVTADVGEAALLAKRPSVSGIVVDSNVLSQTPARELSRLRAASPLVGILLVASELRASLLNDIQPLRVELLARPLPAQAIERFVRRTLSAGRLSDQHVGAWIDHLASAHKLSGSDVALFSVVLDRETPDALCARLNIDQATLSRGLRRLVKKCRVRNTDRLAKNLMRDALLFGTGATPALERDDRHAVA